jgi:hypothetical protein
MNILNFNNSVITFGNNLLDYSSDLYTFSTFTFTNAGSTGRTGPSLVQIQNTYSSTSWTQNTSYLNMTTRGVQLWTVPSTANYRITVAGACGGNNNVAPITGGYGAIVISDISLVKGATIAIVVGQSGSSRNTNITYNCAAGGGGSFVYDNTTNTLYIAAGGGGGAAGNSTNLLTSQTTAHGKYNQTSGSTVNITNGAIATGGTNGNGGSISTRNILYGGPGAGFISDGRTANGLQGISRASGWSGGTTGTVYSNYGIVGGFGGGGASGAGEGNASYANYAWAGGGGGYSGGACGGNGGTGDAQYGGGGGSYYSGTFYSGSSGTNNGHGYVIITKL